MKKASSKSKAKVKPAALPETPLHRVRTRGEKPSALSAAPKRAKIFSRSRDIREDRGERKVKTSQNPRTISR